MEVPPLNAHQAKEFAGHLLAAKMFSLASCVMLFYDIIITFGDEVEKIWKQRFTGATVLWFLNRYLSPLGYIVVTVSFHDPNWGDAACNRYVRFPEILKVFTASAIGVIFSLRLYSIYGGSKIVLFSVVALLVAEIAIKIWSFTEGRRLILPPGLDGCILTGPENRIVFTWAAELVFDSVVFFATLTKTLQIYRQHRYGAAIPLVKIMMRDGIIYFLIIFVANVVTVTLFLTLPPDLKVINASFSTLITSLMVSRLILNLRSQALRPAAVVSFPSSHRFHEQSVKTTEFASTIIGNLGQPINSWFDDERNGGRTFSEDDNTYALSATLHRSLRSQDPLQSQIVVEVTRDVAVDGPRPPAPKYNADSTDFEQFSGEPRSASTTHTQLSEFEPGSEEDLEEHWQPPPSWRLEDGVDISELGKPRHSQSSRASR